MTDQARLYVRAITCGLVLGAVIGLAWAWYDLRQEISQ